MTRAIRILIVEDEPAIRTGLTDADLARAYKSTVDPRLNYEQAMEIAMRIAGLRH